MYQNKILALIPNLYNNTHKPNEKAFNQLNKKGIKMSISLARHHLAQVQKRVDYLKNIVEGLQGVHSEALALALNTTIEKAEADFKKACIELEQAEKSYNDILQKAKEKAEVSKNNHIVSRTLKWS